jgi:sugar O-acyltransferase (sialic acid O-acetyltransferase NeuD family)
MKKLYIIGAGGHGQVVLDCARASGFEIGGFLDDNEELYGKIINGVEVIGKVELSKRLDGLFIVAIGDNTKRKEVVETLNFGKGKFAKVIHPSATIGSNVEIGEGSMIIGGVVVNTNTKIGRHVIINTSSSIDHHNEIGDFVHIAPGTHTGGNVHVGEGAFVGIGVSVIPEVKVGKWSIVGAGSVIIEDVPDYATVVGNPGKVIKIRGERVK